MSDVGDLLAGRYRLQHHLGSGAMGTVWQAVDELLQRPVAVKQLLPQAGMEATRVEEARQRAMREGRIAARLHHPNAIAVHDVAEDNGLPVLVMEYLPSRSLANMLAEQGTMAPATVAAIGLPAASALAAAHAAGIVHRDIKPGNLLLGDDGSIKITDFGISHAAGDISVTQTGMLAGTPAYLAPEIARGHAPTPSSDLFSLGATLYAATEGTPPFTTSSENSLALLQEVAAGNVRPPQQAGPLTPVLAHMLCTDPEQRLTPAETHAALQAVAAGQPAFENANPAAATNWHTQPLAANSAGTAPTHFDPTRSASAPSDHGPNGTSLRPATGRPAAGGPAAESTSPQRSRRRIPVAAVALLMVLAGFAALTQCSPGTGQNPSQQPPPANTQSVAPPPPQQEPTTDAGSTGEGNEDKKEEDKKGKKN